MAGRRIVALCAIHALAPGRRREDDNTVDLTDAQWSLVEPNVPSPPPHEHGGRPRACHRNTLDGILWIMRTGAPWKDLPRRYPSRQVCNARFCEWAESGALSSILSTLAEDLEYRAGVRADDPDLQLPRCSRDRASWWWQTVVLLRSADAAMITGKRSPGYGPCPAGVTGVLWAA
jgi:transposase